MKNLAPDRTSLGYASAALFNFVFLLCVNAHEAWRPWLGGVVTDAFGQAVWAINLVLVVQIFGDLLLSVAHPQALQRFVEVLTSIALVFAAVVFSQVFPFELARFGKMAPTVAHLILFALVLATSLAVIVNVARFMQASRGDDPRHQTPSYRRSRSTTGAHPQAGVDSGSRPSQSSGVVALHEPH